MADRISLTRPDSPPPAGPYSHGIVANGFLYTAGLSPHNAAGEIVGDSIGEQTRQAMRNVLGILAAHGLDASHLVKTTVHLADIDRHFAEYNAAYREFLVEPFPVRTTVGSTLLGDILVEIDAVAVVPAG